MPSLGKFFVCSHVDVLINYTFQPFRWRKIQNLGLSSEYKNVDSEIGRWLKHFFGLTFLSPEEVGDSFIEDFMSDKPTGDERVDRFVDYLVDNYIEEDSKFPPKIWAECTGSIFRTTNACESFHSKFSRACSSPHPNINVFIETLKNIQIDSYIQMNSVTNNENRFVKKDVIRKQEFIDNKISQYQKQNIRRYDFVRCVSYKFGETVII